MFLLQHIMIKKSQQHVNSDKTLGCFLKKIRNGIAHISNCEPINDNGKWIGIKIKDINTRNRNTELEITLKYKEIKIISKYISDEYQREKLGL